MDLLRSERSLDLRYRGSESALTVPAPSDRADRGEAWRAAFTAEHRRRFGHQRRGQRSGVRGSVRGKVRAGKCALKVRAKSPHEKCARKVRAKKCTREFNLMHFF